MIILAYVMTGLTIAGTVGNAMRRRWCFYLWTISNAFWCVYNLTAGEHPQAVLYGFNMAMALYGLFRWDREERAERKARACLSRMPEEGEEQLAIIRPHEGEIRFYHARRVTTIDENGKWTNGEYPEKESRHCEWLIAEDLCEVAEREK